MKAIWNDEIIAESNATIVIEGNHYFPPESVSKQRCIPSATHTTCPWKGIASYYSLQVNGSELKDAAWYYPNPKPEAAAIQHYIAFWKGVEITE